MKMNDQCLPCLVSQAIKVSHMTQYENKEELYHKVFEYLSTVDFSKTNPEIIGDIFRLLKGITNNNDPYKEIRDEYNQLLKSKLKDFEEKIFNSDNPFLNVIKYAIMANVIDFSPMNHQFDDIMSYFEDVEDKELYIDDHKELKEDLLKAKNIVYIGDNCGEIVFDYLFMKYIKEINKDVHIDFVTRGTPVVNDSIKEDAYFIGIDQYASIIDNGDDSLGTIMNKVSHEFLDIYNKADVIINKGSANFESLSDEFGNRYFLMIIKCPVIASYVNAPAGTMNVIHRKS